MRHVHAGAGKRRPHLAGGVGQRLLPVEFAAEALIIARRAAQQALGRIGIAQQARAGRNSGCAADPGGGRRGTDKVGLVARHGIEIHLHTRFAAEDRIAEDVIVIERSDHRDEILVVGHGQAEEIHSPHVEEAAIALAGQIGLRDFLRFGGADQAIVTQEGAVGRQGTVPTPLPLAVDDEIARTLHHAAVFAVARQAGKLLDILLLDAGGADVVRAVDQPLAPLSLGQQALFGEVERIEGQIAVGRDVPEERHAGTDAKHAVIVELRHQEAGLALHRGVGRGKVREIGERQPEELERGVLVIDHLLVLIVNDAGRLDLPENRLFRMVLAGFAGGIDAILEHRDVAVRAIGAGCREMGLVRGVHAQRIQEPVAEILGQLHGVGGQNLAVGLLQQHVALGAQRVRLAVEGHALRLQGGAVVIDLDVADRRDLVVLVVVDQLVGGHEHLLVGVRLGQLGVGEARRLRRCRAGLQHSKSDRSAQKADGKSPAAPAAARGAPAGCSSMAFGGGKPDRHPSSRCNNTRIPRNIPATAGNHAAATGCTTPASPKSSASLVPR